MRLIVAEIHEDLVKAKKESLKDRIPPRAPRDKPTVLEGKDDTLLYAAYFTDIALHVASSKFSNGRQNGGLATRVESGAKASEAENHRVKRVIIIILVSCELFSTSLA